MGRPRWSGCRGATRTPERVVPRPPCSGEFQGAPARVRDLRSTLVSAGLSSEEPTPELASEPDVATLLPMVRRIVLARVGGHPAADDLVQETLVRVLAALPRIEPGLLEPYAIVTARNVIATMWRDDDRRQRNQHLCRQSDR